MKLKLTLIALLISATSAHAELVAIDWEVAGDGLATLDTDTGLEWLDLTQTYEMSINQAESLTAEGSAFEGWRLPTRVEVTQLLANTFVDTSINIGSTNYVYDSLGTEEDVAAGAIFQSSLGTTGAEKYSVALHKNEIDGANVVVSGVNSTRPTVYSNYAKSDDYNYSQTFHSVYLVSDGGTTLERESEPEPEVDKGSGVTLDSDFIPSGKVSGVNKIRFAY
jgi:hypothetical protein